MSTSQSHVTAGAERLHALDAVRGTALLLGVVLHATLSFMPGAQVWLVADPSRSTALAMLFFTIHVFRMTLFFLLAGFFAHLLLHRLGTAAFIKNRLKRIAVPLFTFWPIVFSALIAVLVWLAYLKFGGIPKESPPGPKFTPDDFPLLHLWFLWVLLLFYTLALLLRSLFLRIDGDGVLRGIADNVVAWLMHPLGIFALALPTAMVLFAAPKWFLWIGIPTPDKTLYANLSAWVAYGSVFGFGWLLDRQRHLLARWRDRWPTNLAIAIIALSFCFVSMNHINTTLPMSMDGLKFVLAMAYAIGAWAASIAAIGLALRFADGYSPARRYIADASYWIYIIHLPIILALQVASSQSTWPWMLKFPLLLLTGLALMFASYHWLVRGTAIGVMLNGRRAGDRSLHGAAPPDGKLVSL